MGSSVFGGSITGRPASAPTSAVYPGARAPQSSSGWGGVTLTLLALVFLEAAALLAMRHGFRHHHGG